MLKWLLSLFPLILRFRAPDEDRKALLKANRDALEGVRGSIVGLRDGIDGVRDLVVANGRRITRLEEVFKKNGLTPGK